MSKTIQKIVSFFKSNIGCLKVLKQNWRCYFSTEKKVNKFVLKLNFPYFNTKVLKRHCRLFDFSIEFKVLISNSHLSRMIEPWITNIQGHLVNFKETPFLGGFFKRNWLVLSTNFDFSFPINFPWRNNDIVDLESWNRECQSRKKYQLNAGQVARSKSRFN